MEPCPRLSLVNPADQTWTQPCAAVFCLTAMAGLTAAEAIIGPVSAAGPDGCWTADPSAMKALRKSQPDAQLVGLATDRHAAMVMGEAGADLILFGSLSPLETGDLETARWWAELFEVPCACIIGPDQPHEGFGQAGEPEFFLQIA